MDLVSEVQQPSLDHKATRRKRQQGGKGYKHHVLIGLDVVGLYSVLAEVTLDFSG